MITSLWRIIPLFALLMAAPSDHPNFSGYWQLDRSRSRVAPTTETIWMKVEQTDTALLVTQRTFQKQGEENQTFVYIIGIADNQNTMHGAPMKSEVLWAGDQLEFHSLAMFGTQPLHMTSQWAVSADGAVLTLKGTSQFANEAERESLFVMTRRTAADWPEDMSSHPIEKQFKNIQVLAGRPASQLPVIMSGFVRSLGVNCSQCHVDGHFELDERPDKQIARKMLAMMAGINAGFSADNQVSCWTCHRGALKPESSPK